MNFQWHRLLIVSAFLKENRFHRMKIVSQRNQNSIGLSKTFDQINTPKSESMTF